MDEPVSQGRLLARRAEILRQVNLPEDYLRFLGTCRLLAPPDQALLDELDQIDSGLMD